MVWGQCRRSLVRACLLVSLGWLPAATDSSAQTVNQFPGGILERQATNTRARWSPSYLQSFVPPTRGAFTFPAPYGTKAVRITDASDCGGADCVAYVGYSYWRNTNAHEAGNTMWIFIGLMASRGGSGPTLFQYDKTTDAITKVGPLFPSGSKFISNTGEGWYFSASRPNKLYINDGTKLLRYDVVSKQSDTIFDIGTRYGSNRYIWQMHSSNDDLVHSASVRDGSTGQTLGCVVYNETTASFSYFPRTQDLDECHIDKSGRYLLLLEQLDSHVLLENIVIDLQTGARQTVYNAMGHHEMGFGYVIGGDGWNALPNAMISRSFAPTFISTGPVVFYNRNWSSSVLNHVSHLNARAGLPMSQQFACGSNADRSSTQNEIICTKLDTSYQQLVVAPVMTNLDAAGGCCAGDYSKTPKGNLDITGRYFIWTTNLGGNRLDAFLVKVPSHLLVGSDTLSPAAPKNLRIE